MDVQSLISAGFDAAVAIVFCQGFQVGLILGFVFWNETGQRGD